MNILWAPLTLIMAVIVELPVELVEMAAVVDFYKLVALLVSKV
jgi:hypothetical protein